METAVPGKIVDAGGRFEENNRRARGRRRLASQARCSTRNFEIIEPADESAFDALGEEIIEHSIVPNIISKNQCQKSLYLNNILV